ncbi:MAG: RluA family pseudouridine synthase [Candidatus Saccharimonadales bacterium]
MQWKVSPDNAKQRLDVFVFNNQQLLSRSQITKIIEANKVLVNGEMQKPSYKVAAGDKVTSEGDLNTKPTIPKIELPVIYQDDNCLVINKPAGVLSHSKGAFNAEATVASFIAQYITGMSGDRAGIVHRLDRDTSGVMIAAKTPEALSLLQKQFSQRKVKKVYYAVIAGRLNPTEAIIDMPLLRNDRKPKTFKVSPTGKPAITGYHEVSYNGQYSLLRLEPQTGRTHQLRVHLKHVGHAIVGDRFYGGQPADRLYLHAASLEITIPGGIRKVFEVPLPDKFETILKG